jgi:hypothetical protein
MFNKHKVYYLVSLILAYTIYTAICQRIETTNIIEFSKNLPYEIKEQVSELNCRVISEILPIVISNADQKLGYIRDSTTQPVGPPLPVNTKNLERTLPSISNLLTMRETNIAKLTYEEQIEQESNIQGLRGLQGFVY